MSELVAKENNELRKLVDLSNPDSKPVKIKTGKYYRFIANDSAVRNVQLVGLIFDANKTFLLPYALPGIRSIVSMHKAHPHSSILIIGHDSNSEQFGGVEIAWCRAKAIQQYLSNDVDAWTSWFKADKPAHVRWGTREVQLMMSALPGKEKPFYLGVASGVRDAQTKQSVIAFQEFFNGHKGGNLKIDGKPGPNTQRALVQAYMELEDTSLDSSTELMSHGCEGQFEDDLTTQGLQPDDRILEVLFFHNGIAPAPSGNTSRSGAPEYFEWKKLIIETQSFEFHGIYIQIIDRNRKPVKNCKITLKGPTETETHTDNQGFAFFSGLIEGQYSVHAHKMGVDIGNKTLRYPTSKTMTRKAN